MVITQLFRCQVPLGIIPCNEVKTEEMIKTMDELLSYVLRQGAEGKMLGERL